MGADKERVGGKGPFREWRYPGKNLSPGLRKGVLQRNLILIKNIGFTRY